MNKPFIKLLRSPNGTYVYDVGKNDILRVGEDVYSYLEGIMADLPISADNDTIALIEELKQAGYLSEDRPQKIKHPLTDNLKLFLERKINSITLQLTQDCNFRCKYCIYSEEKNTYQRAHSQKHMSWDTAKKSIDFLLDHSVDSTQKVVGFYGGEPLLQFDLLKKVIVYAEDRFRGTPLLFTMTTNGSLLTDEVVEYLDLHNISTMISFDGPKNVHDKNRVFKNGKGTFDFIMERLNNIEEKYPSFYQKLQFNMVMDPSNDVECINFITLKTEDFNTKIFRATYMESQDEEVRYTPEFISKSEYHGFLAYISYFGRFPSELLSPIGQRYFNDLDSNKKNFATTERMPYEIAPGGPCVPGKSRLLVTVDEQLFPCERVNESKSMCIGDLTKGFDIDKSNKILNIAELTADECINCWAMKYCSLCAKMADSGSDLSRDERLLHCSSVKASVEDRLRALILSREISDFYEE